MRVSRALLTTAAGLDACTGLVAASLTGSAVPPAARWTMTRAPHAAADAVRAEPVGGGAGAGQRISVSVPRVSVPRDIEVRDGRLRVPVLLTDAGIEARAVLEGTSCSVGLRAAHVVWLDCEARNAIASVIVVEDGGRVLLRRAARPADR